MTRRLPSIRAVARLIVLMVASSAMATLARSDVAEAHSGASGDESTLLWPISADFATSCR